MNNPKREALPLVVAFKRVFKLISAGFFLPGSAGIIDPCEHPPQRAHTSLTLEQQDSVCFTSQTLLRVLAHGGFNQIIGLEEGSSNLKKKSANQTLKILINNLEWLAKIFSGRYKHIGMDWCGCRPIHCGLRAAKGSRSDGGGHRRPGVGRGGPGPGDAYTIAGRTSRSWSQHLDWCCGNIIQIQKAHNNNNNNNNTFFFSISWYLT